MSSQKSSSHEGFDAIDPSSPKRKVLFSDLGKMDYKACWDLQEQLFQETVRLKFENRSLPENAQHATSNYFLFVEHPHVYTLGKSGDKANLLVSEDELNSLGATFYPINRGGDITYHGPGQIVGYPLFDLDHFFTDIHLFLRYLEESIIRTLAEYQIEAGRIAGLTGVWIDYDKPDKARKIAALGVKCSRWVTMHGYAFNINTDLNYFGHIVPCGIDDKAVTSLAFELGKKVDEAEVKSKLLRHTEQLFGCWFESKAFTLHSASPLL
jgi:lipoyl(octanoyl) transferase